MRICFHIKNLRITLQFESYPRRQLIPVNTEQDEQHIITKLCIIQLNKLLQRYLNTVTGGNSKFPVIIFEVLQKLRFKSNHVTSEGSHRLRRLKFSLTGISFLTKSCYGTLFEVFLPKISDSLTSLGFPMEEKQVRLIILLLRDRKEFYSKNE